MRIDLLAPPFSGHLHPILAMGKELADDFDVRIVSTPTVQQRIRDAGLTPVCILSADADERLLRIANPPDRVGSNPVRLHAQFRAAIKVMAEVRRALLSLYEVDRPDLLIVDFVIVAAGPVADELGIAWWTSLSAPSIIETADGPPPYAGGLTPARTWITRVQYAMTRLAIHRFKSILHRSRRKSFARLGLPRLYREDGSEAIYSSSCILGRGLEELEFHRAWPSALRFVGPQLYSPATESPPPRFDNGTRHVLVTAGTHLPWFKEELAIAVRRVARAMPDVAFHFSDGDATRASLHEDGNFVRCSYIDYDTSFGRYDLVVHHAGAGVMNYCLSHGIPAVVFPVDYDQFDNAARLEQAGAAIRIRRLEDLESAIRHGLVDPALRAACATLQWRVAVVREQRPVLKLARNFQARRQAAVPDDRPAGTQPAPTLSKVNPENC